MSKGLQAKVAFIGDAGGLLKTTKSIEKNLKGLSGKFQSLGKIAKVTLGGFAITRVIGFLKQSITAADAASKAQKRLDAVFAASGAKSLGLFKDLSKQATDISLKFGIDDDNVKLVQAKLGLYIAAFADQGKAGADKFKLATQLAFDIDAAGLADAETAAKTIGRILLEPLDAAARLKKLGITLTNEEIESIKELVAQGRIAEAQDVILQAIARSVGGAAAANATALTRLNTAVGEIVESIGLLFLPLLEPLANGLSTVATKVTEWAEASGGLNGIYNEYLKPTVSQAIAYIKAFGTETGLTTGFASNLKAALKDLSEKVGIYAKEIFQGEYNTNRFKETTKNTETGMVALGEATKGFGTILIPIIQFLALGAATAIVAITGILSTLASVVTGVASNFLKVNVEFFKFIGGSAPFKAFIGLIQTGVTNLQTFMKKAATAIGDSFVGEIFDAISNFFNNIFGGLLGKMSNAISNAFGGSKVNVPFPNTGNPIQSGTYLNPVPKTPTPKIVVPNLNDFGGTDNGTNKNDGNTIVKELPTIINVVGGGFTDSQNAARITQVAVDAAVAAYDVGQRAFDIRQREAGLTAPITVNVQSLVPTAQTGKVIVDAIQQYTARSGNSLVGI